MKGNKGLPEHLRNNEDAEDIYDLLEMLLDKLNDPDIDQAEAGVSDEMRKLALHMINTIGTRDFNVGDNVKWRGMDLIVVEVGIGEILIATSENVEDDNYNDWWVGTQYVC